MRFQTYSIPSSFVCQAKVIYTLQDFWDFPFTFQTHQTKRVVYCALGTPSTPEPRYLILSTLHVLNMGGTSSTTTTEPILRIQRGILPMHTTNSANWKYMVIILWLNYKPLQFSCCMQQHEKVLKHIIYNIIGKEIRIVICIYCAFPCFVFLKVLGFTQ